MKPRPKTRLTALLMGAVTALSLSMPSTARAQAEPFVGQLMLFGGNFCPRNWANADGQLLAISQNQALFSLLGTMYGGDGRTNFGLPDLRGRVPLSVGQGPGLSNYVQGAKGGSETARLTNANQLPQHSHEVMAANKPANKSRPGSDFLGANVDVPIYTNGPPDRVMDPGMIGNGPGTSQPFDVRTPYQALRWCVALQGIYPSRN